MSNNKTMSWGWIIFWIIFFWPVGLIFLFQKLGRDKLAVLKNSKIVSIIAEQAVTKEQSCVVACKGCGAKNTVIIGQIGECEYCCSPIE